MHMRCRWMLLSLLPLMASAPLAAQIDLSGTWGTRLYGDSLANRPGPGPTPVDYMGIPLNEAARVRALSYSPSQVSEPEKVCALYAPSYVMIGPFGLKIWNETEAGNGSTIAWKIGAWEDREALTVWMDGRPHPSKNAPHENSGFSTGVWEDDVLVIYTTHMKAAFVRRNGTPLSDHAAMTMRLMRHGDILTVAARIDDPLYLTEPLYVTRVFQLTSVPPMRSTGQPCIQGDEGVPEGAVPHYLPGQNPFLLEMTRQYNIPQDTALGGAETMYPDYRKKLKDRYTIPEKCTRYCGGPGLYPLRVD